MSELELKAMSYEALEALHTRVTDELDARDEARREAAREAYLDSLEVAPEGRGAFEPERVVPE